ncbi:MAG: M48 family metalloprotease [Candidatus Hydrogenedentes bacterium]|nr:M48 family metalloprotease [Candidatus Hydrogenedentota bacterium]
MGEVESREAADQRNAQLLRQAFTGKMRRPQPGARLIVALGVTAVVMVLLPVLYVLLVLVIAGAVVGYAIAGAYLLSNMAGGPWIRMVLYFAPIIAGIITVFFMLKPLIAPRIIPFPTRELRPEDEPLLFEFLYAVCNTLGAPCPSRVEIELGCNAGASFRRGFLSFLNDDMVLRIGMPLAGNLAVQEFAAVMAHEFGHFSQRTSMRLGYVVHRINLWFARVVYERDSWDARLEAGAENAGCLMGLTTLIARAAVYLSRRVLWCLMWVGSAISSYTSRQMEYHADACAARFAGSEAVTRSMHRTSLLVHADVVAAEYMMARLREHDDPTSKIPANYAKVVAMFAEDIMKRTGGRSTVTPRKTGLFDTHPSELDRIERVRALNEPGVFHLNGPASALFRDFDRLAKRMSKERALQLMPYLRRG